MEQELLNVFRDLKFNVNVLLALTAVLVIIGAIRVFLVCRWHAMELRGKSFRLIAEDLFETGNFESLEAVCNDKLKKRPAHADAHWYLGKSLFAQKRYQDAKAHLERLIELEPGWDASHVRPYLDRIEAVRVDRQTPTSFS